MRTREEDVELVYDKSRSGTSECSSKVQQWSQERYHLNVQGRNLESEKLACQKRDPFSCGAKSSNSSVDSK